MNKFKPCPFCEKNDWSVYDPNHYLCKYCGTIVGFAFVDCRPIESSQAKLITLLGDALKNIEWEMDDESGVYSCEVCGNDSQYNHNKECKTGKAISNFEEWLKEN